MCIRGNAESMMLRPVHYPDGPSFLYPAKVNTPGIWLQIHVLERARGETHRSLC